MSEIGAIVRYIWEKHCHEGAQPISPEQLCECLVEIFERDITLDKGAEELIGKQMKKRYGTEPRAGVPITFKVKFNEYN